MFFGTWAALGSVLHGSLCDDSNDLIRTENAIWRQNRLIRCDIATFCALIASSYHPGRIYAGSKLLSLL